MQTRFIFNIVDETSDTTINSIVPLMLMHGNLFIFLGFFCEL